MGELPHVLSDRHAVTALGWMLAELERKEAVRTDAAEWVALWEQGLAVTSDMAEPHAVDLIRMAGGGRHKNLRQEAESMADDTRRDKEAEAHLAEQLRSEPQDIVPNPKYADPVAESDNLVSLIPCQIPGCENVVPADKGIPLCPQHEPQEGSADQVEVGDK